MNTTSKRLLVSGALAGALLLGGLPALALANAEEKSPPPRSATQRAGSAAGQGKPQGPPPWVHLRGDARDAAKQRWKDERHTAKQRWKDERRAMKDAWKALPEAQRQGPPPWSQGRGRPNR